MAFFIESKPCERETVFRCRLFRVVFTALSLGFHVSCRITAEGVFFSHSRKEKGPFFVYLHHCQVANKPSFKERGPLSNGCCFHGDRGMKCSLLIQYEWPFCLSSLSSDCPEKHKATNTSMDFQSHNWACRDFSKFIPTVKRSQKKMNSNSKCAASQTVSFLTICSKTNCKVKHSFLLTNIHFLLLDVCFSLQSIRSAVTLMNCLLSLCTSLLLNNRGHGNMSCLTSQPSPAAFYRVWALPRRPISKFFCGLNVTPELWVRHDSSQFGISPNTSRKYPSVSWTALDNPALILVDWSTLGNTLLCICWGFLMGALLHLSHDEGKQTSLLSHTVIDLIWTFSSWNPRLLWVLWNEDGL